jgi:hypothetical protein
VSSNFVALLYRAVDRKILSVDYPLENLGPEKFQQFCQALLVREFGNLQCFPVAQRDGGRDAVSYLHGPTTGGYAVFQVKFVRNPLAVPDVHRWLTDTIRGEIPAIAKLVPNGATHYYLLTNVPGTAHFPGGSIDKVQAILRENVAVPAHCWWRDDLCRRLDSAWNVKWTYPELMTGPDLLRVLLDQRFSDSDSRRALAIRTFLAEQKASDSQVKFKQVELHNDLMDLFVDIPLTATPRLHRRARRSSAPTGTSYVEQDVIWYIDEAGSPVRAAENVGAGAADLILGRANIENAWVVLEGAPGQGKSTISQFVCQAHRLQLLGGLGARWPLEARDWPARLPFKVDLRDLAVWLGKRNPFSPDESLAGEQWRPSLEAFLAALVRNLSGGGTFDISDLHQVFQSSSVLLVFDGLDEVADIPRRREVVDELLRGLKRLESIALSMQVIVTSRPAAFANSPGMPEHTFVYLQMANLNRVTINAYAEKWLDARKLQGRERAEVKAILREKLDQSHLRDLARNPMQLTILLSLIHSLGPSLPEKRTALYDEYIKLFFSRESEKSSIVREHRELLLDIHRYLAWTLQAEAEQQGGDGSVTEERLMVLLKDYLIREGRSAHHADELFAGMVERVVALVQRVQGTYEFEVQPLREYFAARFLYETAPYSPPGKEQTGTKPDRFDALVRNFYWLNVARFYAGCFSKGELLALVDRLDELVKDEYFRRISHPRTFAATLLSDWVFAQHPKAMQQVVSLVLDGLGLRFVTSSAPRWGGGQPFVLPLQCGHAELIAQCKAILDSGPPRDYAIEVVQMLAENLERSEAVPFWLDAVRNASHAMKTPWMRHGLILGTLSRSSDDQVRSLLHDIGSSIPEHAMLLARAGRIDLVEATPGGAGAVVESILNVRGTLVARSRNPRMLERFARANNLASYVPVLRDSLPFTLSDLWAREYRRTGGGKDEQVDNGAVSDEVMVRCRSFCEVVDIEIGRSAAVWSTTLAPWDAIVESSRQLFDERPIQRVLATTAAGIRSTKENGKDFSDLRDKERSLCQRVRYARLRTGSPGWWQRTLSAAEAPEELSLALLVSLMWASPATLTKLSDELSSAFDRLNLSAWLETANLISECAELATAMGAKDVSIDVQKLPIQVSPRLAAAFMIRATAESAEAIYSRFIAGYSGTDSEILEISQEYTIRSLVRPDAPADTLLSRVRDSYVRGALGRKRRHVVYPSTAATLPSGVARQITEHAHLYPRDLVAQAEATCRQELADAVIPVGQVARQDGWVF